MDSIFPVKWAGSFSTQTFYCGQNLWHKIMPLGCDYFWREINISLSAFWQFYIHRFPSNCAHYWPPLQLQFSALQFKQLCIVIQPGERTSLTFPAFKLNSAVKNWEKSLIKSKADQDVVRRKADTNQTTYLSKSCLTYFNSKSFTLVRKLSRCTKLVFFCSLLNVLKIFSSVFLFVCFVF